MHKKGHKMPIKIVPFYIIKIVSHVHYTTKNQIMQWSYQNNYILAIKKKTTGIRLHQFVQTVQKRPLW